MTYLLISLPFLALTALLVVLSARMPGFRKRLLVSTAAFVVLFVLTAIFDNVMIAAGLFTYPEQLISGIRIGLAPIEDFAYPLCLTFGLPALGALLPTKKESV